MKLADYLKERGFTREELSEATRDIVPETLSQLVLEENPQNSLDLPALAALVEGLRKLTGEETRPGELLEFVPESDNSNPENKSVISAISQKPRGRKISLSEAKRIAMQAAVDADRERIELARWEAERESMWEEKE